MCVHTEELDRKANILDIYSILMLHNTAFVNCSVSIGVCSTDDFQKPFCDADQNAFMTSL